MTSTSLSEYLIPDVSPGETVTLAVKIAFAGGMGVSPRISYTMPLVSGVEETLAADDCLTIYPNPVCSGLNVIAPGTGCTGLCASMIPASPIVCHGRDGGREASVGGVAACQTGGAWGLSVGKVLYLPSEIQG